MRHNLIAEMIPFAASNRPRPGDLVSTYAGSLGIVLQPGDGASLILWQDGLQISSPHAGIWQVANAQNSNRPICFIELANAFQALQEIRRTMAV